MINTKNRENRKEKMNIFLLLTNILIFLTFLYYIILHYLLFE
jgi:hypothetical protein